MVTKHKHKIYLCNPIVIKDETKKINWDNCMNFMLQGYMFHDPEYLVVIHTNFSMN